MYGQDNKYVYYLQKIFSAFEKSQHFQELVAHVHSTKLLNIKYGFD